MTNPMKPRGRLLTTRSGDLELHVRPPLELALVAVGVFASVVLISESAQDATAVKLTLAALAVVVTAVLGARARQAALRPRLRATAHGVEGVAAWDDIHELRTEGTRVDVVHEGGTTSIELADAAPVTRKALVDGLRRTAEAHGKALGGPRRRPAQGHRR